ncbi:MAG: N-acetylmuramoyl-L-alanine amidase [Bacteroidetes bacterium]|nr:N-acetylmuramoyl-L-alanine amidase [Bacteroidota bacterium]
MRIGITIILTLAITLSVVEGSFAQINPDSLISVYTKKMQKYLDKENKLSEFFSFTKEGIEVYQPATDTSKKKLQFLLQWNKTDSFILSMNSKIKRHYGRIAHDKELSFLAIALDPGHIGGDLESAKKEKKWVEIKSNPPIQLIEGNLTLATAKVLKKKLEREGATVMLTRNEEGISSFGVTYEKWKDSLFLRSVDSAFTRGDISFEEKNFLLTKANDLEIFRRFFLQEDLRERAKKINEFHPDLTLIIHYNVDETNKEWNKPTKKDFNMAFVGGSFSADELDKPEARIDFLRLLLTDDIQNSILFSKFIVESLVEKTKVPAAMDSCAIYLKGNCLNTDVPGVFCRNLALTRMVRGTLCYGESLCQDNSNESKALNQKDSKRIEEVAEAYFEGIMNYVKSKNK